MKKMERVRKTGKTSRETCIAFAVFSLVIMIRTMKTLPACAIALMFQFAGLSAATVEVDSTIDSVTVYQGTAKVTRSFQVNLPAGETSRLHFAGIPSGVDQSYVQVALADGAPLDFGVATFTNQYKDADRSQVLKELEAKLRDIEARKAILEADKKAMNDLVQSRQRLLISINQGLAETGKPELYELARAAYSELESATRNALEKGALLDEDLRKVGEDLALARDARDKQAAREQATCANYSVEVVSGGGLSHGTISYYVDGVYWEPSYVVKADTTAGSLDIAYLCSVHQNTGEDWKSVALSLATARPSSGAKPREPRPVYLSKMEEIALGVADEAAAPAARNVTFAAKAEMAGRGLHSGAISSVTATAAGFSATLAGRVSVLSGDEQAVLPLASKSMPCEFHTETIPLTASDAFLVAKLKNAFALPMLAGTMQVVVDGSTNGTGLMEETLPGAEITMGLGVNQNIVVKRKTIAEKTGTGGLFGGKRVEERRYLTTVTNHMKVPARVLVKDSVPISRDEKIVVTLEKPAKAEVDPEKGTFTMEQTIQPGASVELPTEFTIAYPADWDVTPH
jgi:uncharacterized protein (TIGR02231 family)